MERTGGPGVIPALRVSVFTEQVEAMIFAPHVHAVDGGVHGQNDRFTSAVHLRLWSSTERRQCAREASLLGGVVRVRMRVCNIARRVSLLCLSHLHRSET